MHSLVLSGVFSSDNIEETMGRIHLSENNCIIHMWERKIGHNWNELNGWNVQRSLSGVIENGLRMSFMNLTHLSSSTNLGSVRYCFDAKAVIIGLETCDPQKQVFSHISFKTTDAGKIFYARLRQGTSLETIQDSLHFWEDDCRKIGVMQSSRRPLLELAEAEDTLTKSEIVIQFSNPKPLWEAIEEMERVSDFLSIVCGKTQFCREVRIYGSNGDGREWDVHLGYVRPRPEYTSIRRAGTIMLIDPFHEVDLFGQILIKWLKGDDDTSTRRARHLVLQGWGSPSHDVDRLVRSATAYQTKLSNEKDLSDTIKAHIKDYTKFFQELGLDTDHIVQKATCSRHYHIHGRHPLRNKKCQEYDLDNGSMLIQATCGLEFLFLVPSLMNCGWDGVRLGWSQYRGSMHPFSIYLQQMISDFNVTHHETEEKVFLDRLNKALPTMESS